MIDRIQALQQEALKAVAGVRDAADLERIRLEHLGRRAALSEIISGLGKLSPDERPQVGRAANQAKRAIEAALEDRDRSLESGRLADLAETEAIDVTFPAPPLARGRLHVLTRVQREIESALETLGYQVETGPEVETDWYNFEALNLTKEHTARDGFDSFYLAPDLLLRTHTSPVQIRAMERRRKPPIYVIAPGRCYRRDAIDASHYPCFTQIEGLAVDRGLTVGDLKGTLLHMVQSLYGQDRQVRIRPSYFPFTEPSFEFDVSCGVCGGTGCRTCGGDGWLEVGGCGMVHPDVLRHGGIDPDVYSGFAWGFGIERMAMLKHDIDDIRLLYENDVRFLEQV